MNGINGRVKPVVAIVVAIAAATVALTHAPYSAGAAARSPVIERGATTTKVPSFGHIFVIVGENKSLPDINSSDAPYIMDRLKPKSAWFTNYNEVAHGSLADYIGLTSGQYASCQTTGPCGTLRVRSIFSQLGKGKWADWNESMPSNCYRTKAGSLAALNAYKAGHNPGLYYAGLACSTHDMPAGSMGQDDMSTFNRHLARGTVPRYNFITPNLCEDGEYECNGPQTTAYGVTEFDNFLRREIPLIKRSPAFGAHSIIFTTFDEGSRGSTNTMMLVTGPQVVPGTHSHYYDHYSTLATIERGLKLPCLAGACSAHVLPAFGKRR